MKRILIAAAVAGLLASAGFYAHAQDDMHKMMHEMTARQAGMGGDKRTELKLPDTMKVMQKNMMREHLKSIAGITGALAEGDLFKASRIAGDKLGSNPEEEARCRQVSDMTGEKDFFTLGMAVHRKADELVDAASANDMEKTLSTLASLINSCNDCHERFRH
jgi:cytochrome c556